jgi:exonuclease III
MCCPESVIDHLEEPQNTLKIIHTNIRSVNCNLDVLDVLLYRLGVQCDIIILTECWLSKVTENPLLNGFTSYSSDFRNQNDGVIIYVQFDIKHSVFTPPLLDAACLGLNCGNDVSIFAIYRSPSYEKIDNFCDSLDSCLTKMEAVKSVIVIGDININILPGINDQNTSKYLDLMSHHGILAAHFFPTHFGNCIDHVMLRTDLPAKTFVLDSLLTDHSPLFFCLDLKIKRHKINKKAIKIDYPALTKSLTNTDFGPILMDTDEELDGRAVSALGVRSRKLSTGLNGQS